MNNDRFILQKHQQFVKRFFASEIKPMTNILYLFYATGVGKTCASVLSSEAYIKYLSERPKIKGNVYIISNISSKNNFIKNITEQCGNLSNNLPPEDENSYITKKELESLNKLYDNKNINLHEIKNIKKKLILNKLTSSGYKFFTFQAFGRDSIYKKISNKIMAACDNDDLDRIKEVVAGCIEEIKAI